MSDNIMEGLHEIKKPQAEDDSKPPMTEEDIAFEKSINDKLRRHAEKNLDILGKALSSLKQKE